MSKRKGHLRTRALCCYRLAAASAAQRCQRRIQPLPRIQLGADVFRDAGKHQDLTLTCTACTACSHIKSLFAVLAVYIGTIAQQNLSDKGHLRVFIPIVQYCRSKGCPKTSLLPDLVPGTAATSRVPRMENVRGNKQYCTTKIRFALHRVQDRICHGNSRRYHVYTGAWQGKGVWMHRYRS